MPLSAFRKIPINACWIALCVLAEYFLSLFATKSQNVGDLSAFVAEAAAVKSSKALSNRGSSGFFLFFEDARLGVERLGCGSWDELGGGDRDELGGGGRNELGDGGRDEFREAPSFPIISVMSISFSIGICNYKERVISKAPGKTKKISFEFWCNSKTNKDGHFTILPNFENLHQYIR